MVHPGQQTAYAGQQKVYTNGDRTRRRVSHGLLDLQAQDKGTNKDQQTKNTRPSA